MQFPDLTAKRAELTPDRTALVDTATGFAVSYADLEVRASRAAAFLREEWGVRRGDRVATLAHNRTDTVELLFACAKLGAILVPLNWRLAEAELGFILEDADPVGLLADEPHAEVAAHLRTSVPGARGPLHGLTFGDAVDDAARHASAADLPTYAAALASREEASLVHAPRDEADPWYLMYTSGTTGRPKGVINTAGMAVVNHLNIGTAAELVTSDVHLSVLPQFHTGGWNLYALPTLLVGGTVLLPRSFEAEEALRLLGERATVFFGVPTIYQLLVDHPAFADADLSGVRSWSCGGAAMPVPLLERLGERGIEVQQGMGMTETGPTVFLLDRAHAISKAGSVGKPQSFVDVRIADPEDSEDREVATGERGELLIKGPGVTPGYWRRPEATAEAFTEDGWLRSGDIARRDGDGFYYIVDRAKDMYISGGENVYPAEVEAVLVRLPGVEECAVVGVPDEQWGEVGKAVIVPASGAELGEEEVRAHCRASLASYKVPRHVEWVEALPRNATGKVLKHRLRPGA